MEDLILFDEEEKSEGNLLSSIKDYALFKDIKSTSIYMKSKGTIFTKEQRLELKILLDKYPMSHSKIRRALKISRSTFWRFKIESQEGFWARELSTHKKNGGWLLDDKQKVYVRRLVQPQCSDDCTRNLKIVSIRNSAAMFECRTLGTSF